MTTRVLKTILLTMALILVLAQVGCTGSDSKTHPRLMAFYYPWYGTPQQDGAFIHWRHETMGAAAGHVYPGGEDIGADYFPRGGCYSSHDPDTILRHLNQLRQAAVGVVVVSWLGEKSFEARSLDFLMDQAAERGLKVAFHLEPAVQESMAMVRDNIRFLNQKYGSHPALFRRSTNDPRPLFFLYDSYRLPAGQWARLLNPTGDLTLRGTVDDAFVIGLLVRDGDQADLLASGFDGVYSYFAVDGFSYGSTSDHWPDLGQWANDNDLIFIPAVGPGYSDLRIRPWNIANQRSRQDGEVYDCLFGKAIASNAEFITITSFNEWHEGTQIEPAEAKEIPGFEYRDYGPLDPEYYLDRTAYWARQWEKYDSGEPLELVAGPGACGQAKPEVRVQHAARGLEILSDRNPSDQYPGVGPGALTDGFLGSVNYRDSRWQGYEGQAPVLELDLGGECAVKGVEVNCLWDPQVWIFPVRGISVSGSTDGRVFHILAESQFDEVREDYPAGPLRRILTWPRYNLRYLRVEIQAQEVCPAWHPGDGRPAWLFLDEVIVQADQ